MKGIVRALVLTGILGAAAGAAQAQVGIYVGARTPFGPVAVAVPPAPGPDYVWTEGYYDGPVWVPGRWVYEGPAVAYYGGYDHYRVYDHDDWRRRDRDEWRDRDAWRDRDRDAYRHYDRDGYRHDGDHYRGDHDRDWHR